MPFMHTIWVNNGKPRYNNQNEDTIHFDNAIYRVLHKLSNITASNAEHLKFQEKVTFTHALWVNSRKSK